jgi:hypothetical protein
VTAKVYDELGVTVTSAGVNVVVAAGPVVTITAPANGAVSAPLAPIQITVAVSDPSGTITKVEYYNPALFATVTTAPYSYQWCQSRGAATR